MKTLYDRLSEDNKIKIDNYPYTALKDMIESALKNTYYFNDLMLGEVTTINDCLYNTVFDLTKFYNLFQQ
jgi:hypothetical protein